MFQRLAYLLLASGLGWLITLGLFSVDWAHWGALAGAAVALAWDSCASGARLARADGLVGCTV
jgi:hypothetical protein